LKCYFSFYFVLILDLIIFLLILGFCLSFLWDVWIFFSISPLNQWMLFTLLVFYLVFSPHSFILLFYFCFVAFIKLIFFFHFHPLILKYYFSSYFILVSYLILFLLILDFWLDFFCEMFASFFSLYFFLISPLN